MSQVTETITIEPEKVEPKEIPPLPRLIGLIRKNNELAAQISIVCAHMPYEIPAANLRPYALRSIPLTELDRKLYAKKQIVLDAWQAIASVEALDADVLTNILVILLESQLISTADAQEPILPEFDQPDTNPRATAAHPRAFKGTKKKPPKDATAVHNLQPLLFSQRTTNFILEKMTAHRSRAQVNLQKLGYDEATLERLRKTENLFDIFCSVHFPKFKENATLNALTLFRSSIMPTLAGTDWPQLAELGELYRAMDMETDNELAPAFARLASFQPTSGLLSWARLLASRPHKQRLPLIINSITTDAISVDIINIQRHLAILDELAADDNELIGAYFVLMDAIESKQDSEYVIQGFRICKALGKPLNLRSITESAPNFKWQLALDIDHKFLNDSRWLSAHTIWSYYPEAPWLNDLLPAISAGNLKCEDLEEFLPLILYSRFQYEDPPKVFEGKRKIMAECATALLQTLLTIPPAYQKRGILEMKEYFYVSESVDSLGKNIAGFLTLLPRLCAPPFSKKLDLIGTASSYIEAFGISFLANASDQVLLALEAQSKNNSLQALVTNSLYKFVEAEPEFMGRCLRSNTTKLCNVARVFGTLPHLRGSAVLKKFHQHPLMSDMDGLDLESLFRTVKPFVSTGIASPFSAKLSAAMAGTQLLSAEQLKRGHEIALLNLDSVRLDLLRRLIFETLTNDVPLELVNENTLHAVQIYNRSKHNRRAFKSFLKSYWTGRSDYRENHPLSRKWLAKHPKLDANLFRDGISLTESVEGLPDKVTISVEQDPFEALKLGTYVNSCLSMNGICNDSSLAVVLDINKRVLYARDAKNKVLARQIIAWNEADQLSTFSIYPLKTSRSLKTLFRKYDLAFAAALGTEVSDGDGRDDAADVINILSESWWDDGSWDISELEDEIDEYTEDGEDI